MIDEREREELTGFRRLAVEIGARSEPAAIPVVPPRSRAVRSLAVLPGAFNPPTRAHLALADAAAGLGFDAVLFSLGCVTLDKEPTGLRLEDRLYLLRRLAARHERLGVVLQNRGLYAEQAEALRRAFPEATDLAFLVGMDKVPQLFDRRYYGGDLERLLAELFSRARFVVAPRGRDDEKELRAIFAHPPAERFAERFAWLPLDPGYREISASEARARLAGGAAVDDWISPEVLAFFRRTGAFATDAEGAERYRERAAIIDGGS